MNNQAVSRDTKKRAILYCRSLENDSAQQQRQSDKLHVYAKEQGFCVTETFMASGTMDPLTYHSFRLRARYREFEILLVTELDVLGNSAIEITHEINFLNENGVKVISLKEGELNSETLPQIFRKNFRLVSRKC